MIGLLGARYLDITVGLCELQCIAKEIDDNLSKPVLVRANLIRYTIIIGMMDLN
jgi:hypothetical protein